MAISLQKVADRAKLPARRDPYFQTVSRGCALGFRKMATDADGTWVARWRDPVTGKQNHKPLGTFDTLPANERFAAADKAAREWFAHLGQGGSPTATTVREACAQYAAALERDKRATAAADVRRRFAQYVDGHRIASVELEKLTTDHVKAWRRALEDTPTSRGTQRSAASLNRDLVCLRAALNFAHKENHTTTDQAWKRSLVPVPGVKGRRELRLTPAQRQALIAAAPPDLAAFLGALCAIPLRPGALAALTVGDYDRTNATVSIRKDKAHAGRKGIGLSSHAAALFDAACANKLPGAPLFTRADGKPWDKDKWKGPIADAVAAAGLPAGCTAYTLRHSLLSDLADDGAPLLVVASIAGTSARVIEESYYHASASVTAAVLERVAV